MFSRKREAKPDRTSSSNELMSQFGLLDPIGGPGDAGVNDADLEAELALLMGESPVAPPSSKRAPKRLNADQTGVDISQINRLALDSLNNIEDDDNDISDTEDNPDLLAELAELSAESPVVSAAVSPDHQHIYTQPPTPPGGATIQPPAPPGGTSTADPKSLVKERMDNYTEALRNAQSANESSKVRRLNRGLKTLNDLSKKLKSGKQINVDDIPPQVALGVPSATARPEEPVQQQPEPVRHVPEPVQHKSAPVQPECDQSTSQQDLNVLHRRRNEYKQAALLAKRNNNLETAREMFKISKQFDAVINAAESGQPVDLSGMPPSPSSTAPSTVQQNTEPSTDGASEPVADAEVKKLFNAPDKPNSILEALEQRLEKYRSGVESAKSENNSGKARRMGRIVKQYEDAIKSYKSGRSVDFQELPTPPGFHPIPLDSTPSQPVAPPPKVVSPERVTTPPRKVVSPGNQLPSKQLQQLAFIKERQKQFKVAALKAKQAGNLEGAREYLRSAKGFDSMIEAISNGLKINMSNIPRPPGLDEESIEGFEFVEVSDVSEEFIPDSNRDETYKRLEQELIIQMKQCGNNYEHYTQIGDVINARKFEKMAQNSRKDLDVLKNAYRHGDPVPRFHYENRKFTMVQCCTDLSENDLQIHIIRGLQLSNEFDSYVKFEFPYPSNEPQKFESATYRSSNSPEYDENFKIEINRKSKAFLRVVKLKSLKLEVFYKRGFFKSDKFLGSISVKLQPLEDKCEIHECLDLLDGRRPCGGKLEVKIRVRDPFINKQIENIEHKWLILDSIMRSPPTGGATGGSSAQSIEVLKYEKKLLDEKIEKNREKLSPSQIENLSRASSKLENQATEIQSQIRKQGTDGYRSYAKNIQSLISIYANEAQLQLKSQNREKAQVNLTKKKIVEREILTINSRLNPKSQTCNI
ncbi:coiled-coil and C2 domain-containing protein 1-like [Tubulanus polymorphus]|uniref:coiled-coil and C2 domain-containing protein 1-like n=1 Tax=Tubulanus polymorphus TaxID=672921 RepID=UPI003DA36686